MGTERQECDVTTKTKYKKTKKRSAMNYFLERMFFKFSFRIRFIFKMAWRYQRPFINDNDHGRVANGTTSVPYVLTRMLDRFLSPVEILQNLRIGIQWWKIREINIRSGVRSRAVKIFRASGDWGTNGCVRNATADWSNALRLFFRTWGRQGNMTDGATVRERWSACQASWPRERARSGGPWASERVVFSVHG